MRSVMMAAMLMAVPAVVAALSGRALGAERAAALVRAADGAETELPIRSIVLFRSGVGYFERRGEVKGDARAELSFETEQINDIIKSMVILDLDGGRIDAVRYNSKEPLERRLRSFGVDISRAPTIADLFMQLRGSRVSITTVDGPVEGTILGVETRPVPGAMRGAEPEAPVNQQFVNLVTEAGVRSVMIASISSFRFTDGELQEELSRALGALAEQRSEHEKTVDLSFSAGGDANAARRVIVGYVHEMPVWKTSYRLILPEARTGEAGAGRKQSFTLQGWAVVENTTDQDWENVRLSLASGRPVSFTMDLYQPLFTQRPVAPVPVLAGVGPRIYEGAMSMQRMAATAAAPAAADSSNMRFRKEADGAGARSDGEIVELGRELSGQDMIDYAAQAQAAAGSAGETFMYTVDAPVTLERQRSAMLPIVTTPVEGRRVSIYNEQSFARHPMRGVEFTNASDLMPGPVSVMDGASYAGDAQIPHTSREQTRLLSYAVDLDVVARAEARGNEEIVGIKIVDGLLLVQRKARMGSVYTFANNDRERGRLLLVEHPRMEGWTLVEPRDAPESTETLVRFEKELGAGETAELAVTWEQVRSEQATLAEFGLETLLVYAKQGKASQAVVDAFKKAASIQARVQEAQRVQQSLDVRRAGIREDQERIRQNMNSVDRNSDLYRRYVAKFSEQETELERVAAEWQAAEQTKRAAEEELRAFLRDLDVN
ncbi:MAG: hypothetical protein SFZ24_10490 [Planctomycetota bacterium]|nr:hypothetical protein [Planctomycetota bacterium]